MASNFLGDVGQVRRGSAIISAQELVSREGADLKNGMNFRDTPLMPAVFLVLPRGREYTDAWDEASEMYSYEGHDSTTAESGALVNQISMYPDGRVSENGKFLKAANAFKDGIRREPLQVQIYEKIDAGVFFDKGIFNLMDAQYVARGGRKIFLFSLSPVGAGNESDADFAERMLSAGEKARAWQSDRGRCSVCRAESGLSFVHEKNAVRVRCGEHGGRTPQGLL